MGKMTGFLEYKRCSNGDIPPKERLLNFNEFHTMLSEDKRKEQAARCMDCGVPLCQSAMELSGMVTGCPLHNLIPEWNDEIYNGHNEHAFSRLAKTSNFPEFTGRVCPALCEKACMCGQYDDAVTIHDNELFLIENAFKKGYIKPRIPGRRSGKHIAVIGSGPAGLAVADDLNHRGHSVDVFEREDRIGGLLMYGIPNMKLDKKVIERRQKLMEEEGVRFFTSINVGKDMKSKELLDKYDAIVLCCGAKKARELPAAEPGKVGGVYFAVDYLTQNTKAVLRATDRSVKALKEVGGYVNAEGKHVVIVGGGDTGNDCIGTALRQGAASVTALEMMPQPPKERSNSNPWPEWPKTLKTDYGHEEAIHLFGKDPRVFETTVKKVNTDKKGQINSIETVKVAFKDGKLTEVSGSEKTIPCDLLLIAAGFVGCEDYVTDEFGTKRGARGTVDTEEGGYMTSKKKVFSAGDMRRGQSLVVWAISEGKACAKEVDEFLMGYTGI
ncbi:MAG: glutamate synthase subunit beta [Lachnospiraceae bacterium]|nr:glutamate synthase subunit beta [Lachnospiraceae bacterium]